MSGYFSGILVSIVAIFIHFVLINRRIIKINPDWCIRKLKRHAQLLITIWVILIPIFFKLFFLSKNHNWLNMTVFSGTTLFNYLNGLILILLFFFLYLTIYYVIDRSVSTRIMMEIKNSKDKKLAFNELKAVYDVDTKYRNELQGMIDGGFMKKEGEYYINTTKGMIVGRLTNMYKKLLKLGKGG